MSLLRDLSGLALLLVMSGSLTGSELAKRLEVKWSGLGEMIGGARVTLQLADGERVAGRVKGVTATSLAVRVKKTSDPLAYPKGRNHIPRETVSRIEVRSFKSGGGGRIGVAAAAFGGTLFGSTFALVGKEVGEGEAVGAKVGASVAIAAGVAILVYRATRPKGMTVIEILPDSPG